MMKRVISIFLVLVLIFSMAACKPKDQKPVDNGNQPPVDSGNKDPETPAGPNIVERSKGITYRSYLTSTPATLNRHDTTVADASDITNRTEIGFYDIKANDAQDGFEFICEMAAEFPVDVTSKYAGDPTYGVPADAKEWYAYSIKLNPNAKWEDGTPITADDYIYSYSQLINPVMKNVRASEIYQGDLSIANAEDYYKQGKVYEDIVGNDRVKDVPESQYLVTMTESVVFFGGPASEYYAQEARKPSFISADGRDLFQLYSKEKYMPVTDQVKKDLTEIAVKFGDSNPEAWKEFCKVETENPPVDFANVGVKKVSDYEIEFILKNPTKPFFMKYTLTTPWLVHKDTYENNKTEIGGGVTKTSFGNDNTKYMAFGPYKITEYIKDKLVVLSMNENWYGWTDGNHEYYGNREKIRFDVIPEHETAFQMFLKGQLDTVTLGTKTEYAASDYLVSMPNVYTYNMNFHVNKQNLKGFESPGINKTIISYKDFRQAFSLGINRTNFAKARGPLIRPFSGMLNETYITDPDTGQSYRDSEYGKQVLIDVYGGTDIDSGYDLAKARDLLMKAYEEAKANGDYKDGDIITLDYPTTSETEARKLLYSTIENSFADMAKGTPLEGKLKVVSLITDAWNEKMRTGEAQLCLSGGGGGAMDPYGLMEFNIRPGSNYGIEYTDVMLTINIDGKDIEKSCVDWINAVCSGEYKVVDNEIRSLILSKVETRVLQEFASVPLQSSSTDALLSMRCKMQLTKYIPMVRLGETYIEMTDAEWDKWVSEQGGELDYK